MTELSNEVQRRVNDDETDKKRLLAIVEKDAPHLLPVVTFAMAVPTRRAELVNARVEDLDLFNGTLRLRTGTTKSGHGRDLPIPPFMADYFRTLPSDTDFVFYRRDADGMCRPLGDFKRAWRRCLEIAELTHLRFHDLRHVSATDMLDRGTPVMTVCTVAGWTTPAMLQRYYGRSEKRALELIRWDRNPTHTPHTTPHTGVKKGGKWEQNGFGRSWTAEG